jgi:hypothetical protein
MTMLFDTSWDLESSSQVNIVLPKTSNLIIQVAIRCWTSEPSLTIVIMLLETNKFKSSCSHIISK